MGGFGGLGGFLESVQGVFSQVGGIAESFGQIRGEVLGGGSPGVPQVIPAGIPQGLPFFPGFPLPGMTGGATEPIIVEGEPESIAEGAEGVTANGGGVALLVLGGLLFLFLGKK